MIPVENRCTNLMTRYKMFLMKDINTKSLEQIGDIIFKIKAELFLYRN